MDKKDYFASNGDIENIFPELKENGNEYIRKRIIHALRGDVLDMEETIKAIAWLEKQGEKKPTDEVEPKFKVGDWVLNNVCFPVQIASIKDGMYIFTEGDAMSVSFVDENYHLWTIQDAEDGDVLDCEGCEYLLFNSFSNTDGRIKLYCWYNVQTNNFHGRGTDSKLRQEANIHPATKEQRNLLFQKMKEAGYEWDDEKKELKKIEVKTLDADKVIEWLKNNGWCTVGGPKVDRAQINKFKKDFGLC